MEKKFRNEKSALGTAPKAMPNIGKKGLLDAEQATMAKRIPKLSEAPVKSCTGQNS